MEKRKRILISIFAFSFAVMAIFIFTQHGGSTDQLLVFIVFGALFVILAIASLNLEKRYFKNKSIIKIILASIALSFALLLFISVVCLPFVGYKGFDILFSNNTGIIMLILAIAVSPITAKYIK